MEGFNIISALKWSYIAEISAKLVPGLTYLVLTQLLAPNEFGVATAAIIIISISQIFWEAGLGKAIIQRQTDEKSATNFAFIVNLILGLIISALLFSSSDLIAEYIFKDTKISNVLQVMSGYVLLGSTSAIQIAILQKEMQFKKLFYIRVSNSTLIAIVSIILALNDMGHWSLIIGMLAGQAGQVILLWSLSEWRPSLHFKKQVGKEVAIFGSWVSLTSLLSWFYIWGDSLIIGFFLGSTFLGLYNIGNQFSILVFNFLLFPVSPVLYSYLSKATKNTLQLKESVEQIIKTVSFFSIPIAFILFFTSHFFSNLIASTKWHGVAEIIGILALTHGFAWIVGLNGDIYRALGKPKYETFVTATSLFIYLVVYLFSIQKGLTFFLWARFGLAIFGTMFHLLVMNKVLNINLSALVTHIIKLTIICLTLSWLTHSLITNLVNNSYLQFLIFGASSTILITICLYLVERNKEIKTLKTLYKKARSD